MEYEIQIMKNYTTKGVLLASLLPLLNLIGVPVANQLNFSEQVSEAIAQGASPPTSLAEGDGEKLPPTHPI